MQQEYKNEFSPKEVAYPQVGPMIEKAPSLLESNIQDYNEQINYLRSKIDTLETVGHKLHDTNYPIDSAKQNEDNSPSGKLYDFKATNKYFAILNNRLEEIVNKLNNLI